MHLSFFNNDVVLKKEQYQNGRLAILMSDAETGEPFGQLTVNLPEYSFFADMDPDNDTSIVAYINHFDMLCDYDDLLDWLVDMNLVEYNPRTDSAIRNVVTSGFNDYAEVWFNKDVIDQL